MYQAQLTHVIPKILLTNPYESNTLPPSLARDALLNFLPPPKIREKAFFFGSSLTAASPLTASCIFVVEFVVAVTLFASGESLLMSSVAANGWILRYHCRHVPECIGGKREFVGFTWRKQDVERLGTLLNALLG